MFQVQHWGVNTKAFVFIQQGVLNTFCWRWRSIYLVMKVVIVKEKLTCDVLPVAMFEIAPSRHKICKIYKLWDDLKINYSFTEWSTSKNAFSDKECPNLKNRRKGSLENCKAFCLETPRCTAFNYRRATNHCVLRGCTLPVVPPVYPHGDYNAYWRANKYE